MSTDSTETVETVETVDLSDAINLVQAHPAEVLRMVPGRWGRISEHVRNRTAATVAKAIREGQYAAWNPAGHYETTHQVEGDDFVVYARYVGEDAS
jgi:hypothetical protein